MFSLNLIFLNAMMDAAKVVERQKAAVKLLGMYLWSR